MAENEFSLLVQRLKKGFYGGSLQRMANEVGITYSVLSRQAKKGTTSTKTLLKLCVSAGLDPEHVFTIANKQEIHDLITQLYGPKAELLVSGRAKKVAQTFDKVGDDKQRKFFEISLKGLADAIPTHEQIDAPSAAKKARGRDTSRKHGNQ